MATILEQEMFTYFIQLNETEKRSFIEILKAFVEKKEVNTESVTVEEYNREIDEAMKRVKEGDYITLEEAEKQMQSW